MVGLDLKKTERWLLEKERRGLQDIEFDHPGKGYFSMGQVSTHCLEMIGLTLLLL